MTSYRRPLLLLLILLVAFFALDGIGARKLANPDEGRYSEISREMALSGDFVTPRLNGLKYFEKPPLQYWATAIAFKLFGESDFSARLYTTLCGLGCILLVFYTGNRLYGAEAGTYAAAALIGMPYFMALANIVTLDMGLTFWMTLAVCAYLVSQVSPPPFRQRWLLTAWAGMAAAVLSKGLIGIVFPAAALFLYALLQRDWRRLRDLEWLRGLAVFLAIAAPWFVLVSLRNAEFAHFFFIHEHVERFLTNTHHRESVWWLFIAILFGGILPWALVLPMAAWEGWRRPGLSHGADRPFQPIRFVLLFSLFILAFFTKSTSKLPHYILPFFPVLALVVGVYLRDAAPRRLAWLTLPVIPLMLWGSYEAWLAPAARDEDYSRAMYLEMSHWVITGALLVAIASAIAFFMLRRGRKWPGVLLLSAASFGAVELIKHGYERISPLQSGYALSQSIAAQLTPDTRLYTIRNYDQSLPFYLKRTLTMVDYVDEFELGQKQEPARYLPNLQALLPSWNAPGPAIAIIQPGDIDELRAAGFAFDIVHQDPRRIAIKKKSPL
jgi:4-amino-4-deoxy-L-arabinose transferase-like glycosyltransferase